MSIDYQRLEKNLAREFRQYHVVAQAYRLTLTFLGVLGAQLATGWHDWTWKGLIALAAAAGYATLRQIYPTVPWKAFLGHVRVAQALSAQQDARNAQAAAPPTSEQVYTPVANPAGQARPDSGTTTSPPDATSP